VSGESIRVDLSVLLPEVPDHRDACVLRLMRGLRDLGGVLDVHVVRPSEAEAEVCIHYDPDRVSLREVTGAASRLGGEIGDRYGHLLLRLRAIDSEDGARRIENGLTGVDGVLSASVNLSAQVARVEFERDRVSEETIRTKLGSMGHGTESGRSSSPRPAGWRPLTREMVLSLLAGLSLLLAWTGERWMGLPGAVAVGLYVVSYGFGAWDLLKHWLGALRKGRVTLDIDLLMLVAALGAAVLAEWAEGAFLLFLFSLAHALEHMALDRARDAIRGLADLAPATARVLRDATVADIPVESVTPGEWVIVRPGERIPVDGRVRKGRSAVNQAPITGESVPVNKVSGDEVHAGTVNGEGALHIEVVRAVGDRTLDRVIQLVEEAQTKKAPTERFTDRFAAIFVPVILLSAALMAVLPPVLDVWSWDTAFYRSMALLVAASPCALAIGTPSAVLAGIARAAQGGVLFKGGVYIEALGGIGALALDKTGTLTVGRPEVSDLLPLGEVSERRLLAVAAGVERDSQHPLARAVVRKAEWSEVSLPEAGDLESVTGMGVRSSIDGVRVEIGNLALWESDGIEVPAAIRKAVDGLEDEGRSVMVVRQGDEWLGAIGLVDQPRTGVAAALDELRTLGIAPIVMMTGDNRGVAESIARRVGIDEVRADLLPEAKVRGVKELMDRHGAVAMVGDGVNDAPALATATIGIAMGGAGTAAALETADVALMGDELAGLPFAVGVARMTSRVIRQNLVISMAVILILIAATATGAAGIGAAVLVHEGSTLIVVTNALRLLGFERQTWR